MFREWWDQGESMTKDRIESARVRRLVRAKPKECFINAMRVVWDVPEYEDADYVEGVIVTLGDLVTEHGWVEMDAVIVDPTLLEDDVVYFPGLRFTGGPGISKAIELPKPRYAQDLPILNRFGCEGIKCPEFLAAWIAAYRHVGMEEMARWYEERKRRFAAEKVAV